MDASKLRQKVHRLDQQRSGLLHKVLRPLPMIAAALYQMRRRCGNPRCKCTRGELHASWYLSRKYQGRTQLTYIGRIAPEDVAKLAHRYQHYQKVLAEIRKIDAEISQYLNQLRQAKIQSIDTVLRRNRKK